MTERTLPQLFEDSVKTYPENILMWEKTATPTCRRPTGRCGSSSAPSPPA